MSLARSLSRASLRVRTQRALTTAAWTGLGASALAFVVGAGAFAGVAVAALLAFAWRVELARLARALDDGSGRAVAAFELARAELRTPFIEAAIRDADQHVDSLETVALRWPRVGLLTSIGVAVWLLRAPHDAITHEQAVAPTRQAEPQQSAQQDVSHASRAPRERQFARVRAREAALALHVEQLSAELPLIAGARAGSASAQLRKLADAVARDELSSERRAQLQRALEHARERERARRASEQDAEQAPPERKLDRLARPDPPLAQAADSLAQQQHQAAARAMKQAADELDREQRELAQQREQLERGPMQSQEVERQFARAAGGGNERDPGEHEPSERRIGGSYEDQRLRGSQGEGPSRSQVIAGASQAGFASAPYRRVYDDYRAHAEAVLERDDVPQGERFYVRRYFELVQPRTEGR